MNKNDKATGPQAAGKQQVIKESLILEDFNNKINKLAVFFALLIIFG